MAWGVAQWHYMLPQTLTVAQAASPSGTLSAILVVTGIAVVVIFPAIGLLFLLDQRGHARRRGGRGRHRRRDRTMTSRHPERTAAGPTIGGPT